MSLAFVLTALTILSMMVLFDAPKAKGQSFAATDPSVQLCPSGTGQQVTLNMQKALVMKRTIRRT